MSAPTQTQQPATMTIEENPLIETSCVAELKSAQAGATRRYWDGFWPRLVAGAAVFAVLFAAAILIFGRGFH